MIKSGWFPLGRTVAFTTTSFDQLMKLVFRFLIGMAGDAVFFQFRRERFMPEWFGLFGSPFPFVIGVTLDTGVVVKPVVKKYLAALFFQHHPCYRFEADFILFVATDALN